jgi:hypothetical protein
VLCDAATVRENLLHVLGGGITRIWRPSYPAGLGLHVAAIITLQPSEARERHRLRVVVLSDDGKAVAEINGEFGVTSAQGAMPGERLAVPIVLDFTPVQIPAKGAYTIDLLVDGHVFRSMHFVAGVPEQPSTAPS